MSYAAAVESLYALGHELAASAPVAGRSGAQGAPAPPRRKWELAHMRTLCAALGSPQLKFPSVLIAGTNGKGSTSATLASILASAGHRTALYTSPHLVRVNERIQLSHSAPREDGSSSSTLLPIADDDFARLYFLVDDTAHDLVRKGSLPHPPSFFEVMTAIAFLCFAESQCEIAVLEVGLGGRLDATNIVHPLLSVITDISLDHTEWLGNTIAEIAREKAGILRSDGILVTLPQHPEANQVIGEAAVALNVRAISAASYVPCPASVHPASLHPAALRPAALHPAALRPANATSALPQATLPPACLAPHIGYTLAVLNEQIEIESPLAGQHQQRNVALAIAAAVELRNKHSFNNGTICSSISYNITAAAIANGIRDTRWPGRLELLPVAQAGAARFVLLDVAHNPAAAWALRAFLSAALSQLPEDHPRTLLFGCLRDKAIAEMAQILFPLFDAPSSRIILSPVDNPRGASVDEILMAIGSLGDGLQLDSKSPDPLAAPADLPSALARAIATTPPGGLIVATGSIYLVGRVRSILVSSTGGELTP